MPRWTITDIGALQVRAVTVPIYATNTAKQAQFIINNAEMKIIFVGDQEQYDQVLEIIDECPKLEKIVAMKKHNPFAWTRQSLPLARLYWDGRWAISSGITTAIGWQVLRGFVYADLHLGHDRWTERRDVGLRQFSAPTPCARSGAESRWYDVSLPSYPYRIFLNALGWLMCSIAVRPTVTLKIPIKCVGFDRDSTNLNVCCAAFLRKNLYGYFR